LRIFFALFPVKGFTAKAAKIPAKFAKKIPGWPGFQSEI
jgi:hypothetical protein